MSENNTPIEHVLEGLNQAENDIRTLLMIDTRTLSNGDLATLAVVNRQLAQFLERTASICDRMVDLNRGNFNLGG